MAGNNDDITDLKCGIIEQDANDLLPEEVKAEKDDIKTVSNLSEKEENKGDGKNVTFIVKGENIMASKSVLAKASDVFHAMFFGPLAESSSEVKIIDCDNVMAFKDFLKFIEEGNVSLSFQTVPQLWYLSQKYMIELLTIRCRSFVSEKLAIDNALLVLEACLKILSSEMGIMCLEFVKNEMFLIANDESFINSKKEVLKLILEQDQLDITEIDLCIAVEKWCIKQLNNDGIKESPETKREMLGEIRYLIRFPQIGFKKLMRHCLLPGMLQDEEFVSIAKYFALKSVSTSDAATTLRGLPFPQEPRLKKCHVFVDIKAAARMKSRNEFQPLEFKVSNKCWLTGLRARYDPQCDKITFRIQKEGDRDYYYIQNTYAGFKMFLLTTPRKLLPKVKYTIIHTFYGDNYRNLLHFSNPNSYLYQDLRGNEFCLDIVNEYRMGMINGLLLSVIDKTPIKNFSDVKFNQTKAYQ